MREVGHNALDMLFSELLSFVILSEKIKYQNSTPVIRLWHCVEQIMDRAFLNLEPKTFGLLYFSDRSSCITHHHTITVHKHVLQFAEKANALDSLTIDFVDFCDAERSRLAHVGVLVVHGVLEGLHEVLNHLLNSDAPHSTNGHGTN